MRSAVLEYEVVIEDWLEAPVLCVLVALDGVVHAAINLYHEQLARRHADYHTAHGLRGWQICSLERPCDYPGHAADGRV
jgi:hypothetical protein